MMTRPTSARHGRLAQSAAALLILGGVAAFVAGCAPTSVPNPAVSTTQADGVPSAAEGEAYEGALEAVRRMTLTVQTILESGEVDPAGVGAYATGEALQNQLATIQQYRDQGLVASGEIVLEPLDHVVRENGDQAPAVPDGEAVIHACVDYSGWRLTGPDGSDEPLSGPVRSRFEYQVRLDTVAARWQVYAAAATGQDC